MPQPYPGQHWKHGWIPVTEAALRSKLKKGGPPRGKSPKITEAAAEAGAILRRMREQDAARRRSVTHVVDTRPSSRGESSRPAPTRTSSGGSRRPAAGRSTTAAGGEGTSRQADDAIRQAARRRTPAQQQRTTERQAAPTTPEPRRQAVSSRPTPQRQQPAPQPAAQAQPERRPPSVERAMDDIRETAAEIAPQIRNGQSARISLVDLRERLPKDLSRDQVDQALSRLNLRDDVFLVPQSNQKILTPQQRESAVTIGGQQKHWMEVEPLPDEPFVSPRRSPTSGGQPSASGQADDAIRQAAGRQPTPQRQAERPAPRPAAERPAPQQRQAERPPARQPEAASRPAPTSTSRGGTSDGSGAPVDGRPSNKPIANNAWGTGSAHTNEIAYHDDGAIGSAIKRMGDDARMDIDGEPLANVLGKLATDAVAGRKTTQEMVDAVKRIRDRLPAGSAARRELDSAIRDMDAPTTPAPKVPDGVPAPLRELAQALHSVPTVRNDPGTELEPLLDILNRFAQGRTGGRRMLGEVRALANKRHESLEGKAEIDRLIQKALSDLEALARQDRTALYPPRR